MQHSIFLIERTVIGQSDGATMCFSCLCMCSLLAPEVAHLIPLLC